MGIASRVITIKRLLCRCGSVVEHSIRNRAVAGSNPAIGFKKKTPIKQFSKYLLHIAHRQSNPMESAIAASQVKDDE